MSINPHYEFKKVKLDELDIHQLKALMKKIQERIAVFNNTTPEQEEIKRLFHPRSLVDGRKL